MVQRIYVECPSCGKIFQIKVQVDKNVGIYDWPISFSCTDCGDELNYRYSKKGFFPKSLNYNPSPDDAPITTLSYSSSLPIVDDAYMKDMTYMDSAALFSPFMNITRGFFSLEEVDLFESYLVLLQENLLPYRTSMIGLHPLLLKGNYKAFGNKMAKIFGLKEHRDLSGVAEMRKAYFELLERSYINLCTTSYNISYGKKFISPLSDYVGISSPALLNQIKDKLDETDNISVWYNDIAMPYIVKMLADIHKFIPVMIFPYCGISDIKSRGDFKIVTIAHSTALEYYKTGFEVFIKGFKVIVGLTNVVENGDIDLFKNKAAKGIENLTKFCSLSGGKMAEVLADYESLNTYLDHTLDSKLRNATVHEDYDYDPLTQIITCYYNSRDKSKVCYVSLIEVCRMCYIQLLHIMEAFFLAKDIVDKARK